MIEECTNYTLYEDIALIVTDYVNPCLRSTSTDFVTYAMDHTWTLRKLDSGNSAPHYYACVKCGYNSKLFYPPL